MHQDRDFLTRALLSSLLGTNTRYFTRHCLGECSVAVHLPREPTLLEVCVQLEDIDLIDALARHDRQHVSQTICCFRIFVECLEVEYDRVQYAHSLRNIHAVLSLQLIAELLEVNGELYARLL
jgi:hypothetical protein